MDMHDFHKQSSKARQKERQDAIIDYLLKNAHLHINKQMVIDAVTERGKGSRNTIMRDLNLLHQYGTIKIRPDKDKENSQTHWVSINSDSEMLRIMENIQNIRDAFFELLEKASTLPKGGDLYEPPKKTDPDYYETIYFAETAVLTLFEHLVGTFMLYFLLEWPKKVPDVFTRLQLYTLTFQRIQEIQIRILEVFPRPDQVTNVRDMFVENLFILKQYELERTVDALEEVGFDKQTEPLLDQLWKFSLPFVNDGITKTYGGEFREAIRTVSGWRDVIAVKRKGYARRDKDVRRILRKVRNDMAPENKLLGSADSHIHPQEKGRRSPRRKPLTRDEGLDL